MTITETANAKGYAFSVPLTVAAELIGYNIATIRKRINDGRIQTVPWGKARVAIELVELERFAANRPKSGGKKPQIIHLQQVIDDLTSVLSVIKPQTSAPDAGKGENQ